METETTTITAQELNKNPDKLKKSKKKLLVNEYKYNFVKHLKQYIYNLKVFMSNWLY